MQAQILALITPALAAIFAASFAALWWRDRRKHHVLSYAVCFTALTAGMVLTFLVPANEWISAALIVQALFSAGAIALIWGVNDRVGMKVPWPFYTLTVIVAGVFIYFAAKADDQTTQLVAANVNMGLLFGLGAQSLWQVKATAIIDRLLVWTFTLTSAQFFLRPIIAMMVEGRMTAEAYRESSFYAVFLVCVALLTLVLSLALTASVVADQLREQREESATDPLSGLRMRSSFEEEAAAMAEKANKAHIQISLIVADIDHFKHVNDQHGHLVGDKVIAEVGALFRQAIRPKDIAGRLGGEEFGILLWNCDVDAAAAMADRIRRRCRSIHLQVGEGQICFSASFGVGKWPRKASYTAVFEQVDEALYRAKNGGRDQVCRADEAVTVRSPAIGSTQSDSPLSPQGNNVVAIPRRR